MDDPLYDDPELAQFYDLDNGWFDDTRYCLSLAKDGQQVLDLGCGTGLLAAALSERCTVTGVDPAAAMLAIARQRAGGDRVNWVQADARSVRLGATFDLIVMTGHAFQVFLTDDDQRAVCRTIAAHLEPDGIFIFDTREPAREEWREWNPQQSHHIVDHPKLGRLEAWNDVQHDPDTGIVSYGTYYRSVATGKLWQAKSDIRFTAKDVIASHLAEAGLIVHHWYGDWQGGSHGEGSAEIIPAGHLA